MITGDDSFRGLRQRVEYPGAICNACVEGTGLLTTFNSKVVWMGANDYIWI